MWRREVVAPSDALVATRARVEHAGETAVTESMFPDDYPVKEKRAKRPWRPTKDQRAVLDALQRYGPMGEDELIAELVGDVSPQRVISSLEQLGRHGWARDTGRRREVWRDGARCWVWEAIASDEAQAS